MHEHATFTCLTHCNIISAVDSGNSNSNSNNVIVQFSFDILLTAADWTLLRLLVYFARCHHLFGHLADYCADGKIISFEMFQNAAGKVASYNNDNNNFCLLWCVA